MRKSSIKSKIKEKMGIRVKGKNRVNLNRKSINEVI